MSARHFDVAVIGGGMVGAATAILLLREGFSVALVEGREAAAFDESSEVGLRVSALSPGSQSILNATGAWRIIEGRRHCPYRRMQVEESADDDSAKLEFAAAEFGLERLGTIVENDSVSDALWQVLKARQVAGDPLELFCPAKLEGFEAGSETISLTLDSGDRLTASLVVGADGPRSAVRGFAGIEQQTWHYGQKGIVAVVRGARPNPGIAWQRFMEGGPLAFLPLSEGASSIVWTRPAAEAERLLALDDDAFCEALSEAGEVLSGEIQSTGPRAAFDLTMRLSEQYTAPRVALVGDAAHVVHPLAGQGVNMGFLDAAALAEVLAAARSQQSEWHGSATLERALKRYGRWRRSDAEMMGRGIHGIRALFTPAALGPIRRLGLKLVGKSWMAREAFVHRAAGIHADAPALARR